MIAFKGELTETPIVLWMELSKSGLFIYVFIDPFVPTVHSLVKPIDQCAPGSFIGQGHYWGLTMTYGCS